MTGTLLASLLAALGASASVWSLEIAQTEIDLGTIGAECAETPFSIRAKSASGCPLVETTCGCLVVHRDLAVQDADGWWTIPMLRTFGIGSGRESRVLHVHEQGTSESADVRVVADLQLVATLGYSGILMWSTTETTKREQTVSLDFSRAVTVSSVKLEADSDAQFTASVKRLSTDGSRWVIVVKPRRLPLEHTVTPEWIRVSVASSSPRIGLLTIAAMAMPPSP